MIKRYAVYIVLIVINYSSCKKVVYYPDKQLNNITPVILAHRGGGNDTLQENSLEACINALKLTDGLEVDVQISKDRTIWLSHSPKVETCNEALKCFAETKDEVIESINTCTGNNTKYTQLEEVLTYMSNNNIRKYISIDIKGWGPCSGNSLNIEAIMRLETEEIIKLAEKYKLVEYLIFETQAPSVLKWAKEKSSSVNVYVTSFGDYEKGMLLALKHNFDGISYKSNFRDMLDVEKINLLHKKGLRIMAWNIPDSSHMQYLISINTDFLQIDL